MNWNYPFGSAEIIFVLVFILVYVSFFIRTIRVARRLKTTARALIVKFFLRSIAFTLLLISLLGPSFGEVEHELEAQGKDVYLIVDLSKSMDATDVSPSRLEKVKFEINQLLSTTFNNRIGLIVFSNEAYTQSPLTYDQAAFNLYVQSLQTDLLPGSGTNLCNALDLAYSKIAKDYSASNKTKIMILFTDGENNADCKASLFNNIRRFGFKLFIVGVGTTQGSSIRVGEALLRNEDDQIVISKMNVKELENLADKTKGYVYKVDNERNELPKMVADINSIAGPLIDQRRVTVTTNKYFYFLTIALAVLLLDVLITVRTFRL